MTSALPHGKSGRGLHHVQIYEIIQLLGVCLFLEIVIVYEPQASSQSEMVVLHIAKLHITTITTVAAFLFRCLQPIVVSILDPLVLTSLDVSSLLKSVTNLERRLQS